MIFRPTRLPVSPLSLHDHLPERSSPSSVRFAAQNRRALDDSGPFRRLIYEEGKGGNRKVPTNTGQIPERRDSRSPPLDDVNNLRA